MNTTATRFNEVYTPISDALFEAHFAKGVEAEIVFCKEDGDTGRFIAIFETVRPGLFLRASGYLPSDDHPDAMCNLVFGTADSGAPEFDNWNPGSEVSVYGYSDGAVEVSAYSLRTSSADEILLTKTLLDVAVALRPYFEDLSSRA